MTAEPCSVSFLTARRSPFASSSEKVEREDGDLRLDVEVLAGPEEVAGIDTGHVGDAADLALAPEQLVVLEGGHPVEMDGDDTALAEAGESIDDDFAVEREGHGAVERVAEK